MLIACYYITFRHLHLNCKTTLQAHIAIAEAQKRMEADGKRLRVVTQNIDGLHARAGTKDVIEIHGSLFSSICVKCRGITHQPVSEREEDGEKPYYPDDNRFFHTSSFLGVYDPVYERSYALHSIYPSSSKFKIFGHWKTNILKYSISRPNLSNDI